MKRYKTMAATAIFALCVILIAGPIFSAAGVLGVPYCDSISFALAGTAQAYEADIVCDGEDDYLDWQTAADRLTAGGKLEDLCGIAYDFTGGNVTLNYPNIEIQGLGNSTYFETAGNQTVFSDGGYSNIIFKDFGTNGWVDRDNTNDSYCQNVWVNDLYVFEPQGSGGGGGGVTDHGDLAGLGDDDHEQYIKDSEFSQAGTVLAGTGAGTYAERALGIADNNIVEIDDADAAGNDYARFTANGLEGREYSEVLTDLSGQAAAAFDLNSQKITGLDAATIAGDAVRYEQTIGGTDWIDSSHLSQDFGASSDRLKMMLLDPQDGQAIRIDHADIAPVGRSVFAGLINTGGTGGLTATNVPYDNDTNEDMFNGFDPYDGSNPWGQIVLHNETRGNSRKIVDVDRTSNFITTTSSTDDWANNDVITCESQVCSGGTGFFDIDLSDKMPVTAYAGLFSLAVYDSEGTNDNMRRVILQPYEAYDGAKSQAVFVNLASLRVQVSFPCKVVDQKICMRIVHGCDDVYIFFKLLGWWEYADE